MSCGVWRCDTCPVVCGCRRRSEYNVRTRGAIRRLACVFALQKTVWPGLNEQIHVYTRATLDW